jgi:hypothetical protein
MKRHPNVVWLVLCKTRRAGLWHAMFHTSHLPAARRALKEQAKKFQKLDHRLHRVVIPESDTLWIARKK